MAMVVIGGMVFACAKEEYEVLREKFPADFPLTAEESEAEYQRMKAETAASQSVEPTKQ